MIGDVDTGETEDGWGEVDEAYEPIRRLAGRCGCPAFVFLRESDDEGDLEAHFPDPFLDAGHAGTVVGEEEDDGIVGESVFFELFQYVAGLVVHGGDVVVVTGPILSRLGGVGMERRDGGFGGIVSLLGCEPGRVLLVLVFGNADLAFVADDEVEDGEEGLALFTFSPMGLFAGLVPGGLGRGKVVVGLDVVGAVVAGRLEVLGEALDRIGEPGGAPHAVATEGRRVDAGDQAGTVWRANAGDSVRVGVTDALGGQAVQHGRASVVVTVTAEIGTDIFAGDPEDIGAPRLGGVEVC